MKEGPDHAEMIAMVPMPSWLAGREKIEKAVELLGLKLIIGKGMLEGLEEFCQRKGCVHLVCAGNYNEYASRVTRVIECAWPELGRPEAMWIVEVDGLGPLIVDADTKGKSLYQDIDVAFQVRRRSAAGRAGHQTVRTPSTSPRGACPEPVEGPRTKGSIDYRTVRPERSEAPAEGSRRTRLEPRSRLLSLDPLPRVDDFTVRRHRAELAAGVLQGALVEHGVRAGHTVLHHGDVVVPA